MALGKCYRCKTVVEPLLSDQWFVKIKPLAQPAVQVVEEGRVRIIPESWKNNYLGWMRDIKDWCVSRQIWWGHQIPAWYCETCYGTPFLRRASDGAALIPSDAQAIVAKTEPPACPIGHSGRLVQDPDVLDTWFSSALWPFSTLGWPKQTPDLKTFYPTSTLVTGLDILFFWVARMIMMGLNFMKEAPFSTVYIHALVRDAEGQKMSKSKGNVIDPLHVMDQYGTDALRFTLASMSSPGRDVKLAEERIEGYRNFANKIWNAARFILMNLEGERSQPPPAQRSFPNRWILSRLNATIRTVTQELEQYRFDRAASALYQFIWHEYCDWYLELIKPALQASEEQTAREVRGTLVETFETIQRLLHPFMPFITEEIWQTLPHEGTSIVGKPYPAAKPEWDAKEADGLFEWLDRAVTTMRMGRSLLNYPPGKTLIFYLTGTGISDQTMLKHLQPHITHLARGTVQIEPAEQWPVLRTLRLVTEGLSVGVAVEGDVELHKVIERIKKQVEDGRKESDRLAAKLGSQDFVAKAPPEVVAEHRQRLALLSRDQELLLSSDAQLRQMLAERSP